MSQSKGCKDLAQATKDKLRSIGSSVTHVFHVAFSGGGALVPLPHAARQTPRLKTLYLGDNYLSDGYLMLCGMTGDTMQARPRSCASWCCSPTILATSACLPACMIFTASAFAEHFQHAKLQADVTTATMLFTMVEALEAAKAPLQHVYFSQGIKYYVCAQS